MGRGRLERAGAGRELQELAGAGRGSLAPFAHTVELDARSRSPVPFSY